MSPPSSVPSVQSNDDDDDVTEAMLRQDIVRSPQAIEQLMPPDKMMQLKKTGLATSKDWNAYLKGFDCIRSDVIGCLPSEFAYYSNCLKAHILEADAKFMVNVKAHAYIQEQFMQHHASTCLLE